MKLNILILNLFLSANSFAITGLEVATKIYDSHRAKTSLQKARMTLVDSNGSKRVREFFTVAEDNSKYDSKSLIIFTSPKKFKNTAMLTHNEKGTDSNQWLFLPALKKNRRISSGKKSGRFVGSDFTYEDLEDREPALDNHKIIKKVKFKGKVYLVLQSTSKNKGDSIYSKVVSLVNPKDWTVKQAKFYKNKKKPIKTLYVKEFKKIDKILRPVHTQVTHHGLKHKTIIEILSSKDNLKLKKSFFTRQILEKQSSIQSLLK